MRLIDADALLKKLNEEKIPFNSDVNSFIITAPTVDAAPVRHGKWIRMGEPPMYIIECSECRQCYFCHDGQTTPTYCSNCGAKMEGGTDEK